MRARCAAAYALSAFMALQSERVQAEPTAADKTIATQLFDDAEKLMAAGNYPTACLKYAESQRRDPQLGTLLHLADCHEKIGKTASAWAEFKEALEIAARKNASGQREPRERTARARAAGLEKSVSRLTITVAHAGTPGLEVRQSGELVRAAVWGSAVPIDPGVYVMTAHAPGKKTWTKMLEVNLEGADIQLVVPLLEDEGAAPASTSSPARASIGDAAEPALDQPKPGGTQRTVGFVIAGLGTAALGVGAAFGLMSNSKENERDGVCPTGKDCTPSEGEKITALTNEARADAKAFNIAAGIGAAALLGGVALVLTAPSAHSSTATALRIETWSGPGAGGASVRGNW